MGGNDEQGLEDPPPARSPHDARRGKRGEARIPPAVAVLIAIALYAVLPEPLVIGPRFLIPGEKLPLADFRFTQDETQDTVIEVAAGSSKKADWIPTFVDCLYLSTTNSSAFSPTDTMPLTSRAKILMGIQATAALITSLLVIARAVGALGGG